ncbi:hypothetical protein MMC21_001652 [Puttea exsequens]|nr:hypothetical protein [Puttea exsequens]
MARDPHVQKSQEPASDFQHEFHSNSDIDTKDILPHTCRQHSPANLNCMTLEDSLRHTSASPPLFTFNLDITAKSWQEEKANVS